MLEQNQKALNDSVRISKNKVGELEYSKNILVSEKNDLSKLNKDLDNELKKTKGSVYELNKYIIYLKNNPQYIPTSININDSIIQLSWGKDTIFNPGNARFIKGESIFKAKILNDSIVFSDISTKLIRDEIQLTVTQGFREKDGNLEVFVRSNYPGFELKDLNSVIIDPKDHPILDKFSEKPKRFGIGFYGGYGLGINGLSPQIGIGLQYNFIRF